MTTPSLNDSLARIVRNLGGRIPVGYNKTDLELLADIAKLSENLGNGGSPQLPEGIIAFPPSQFGNAYESIAAGLLTNGFQPYYDPETGLISKTDNPATFRAGRSFSFRMKGDLVARNQYTFKLAIPTDMLGKVIAVLYPPRIDFELPGEGDTEYVSQYFKTYADAGFTQLIHDGETLVNTSFRMNPGFLYFAWTWEDDRDVPGLMGRIVLRVSIDYDVPIVYP